MSLHGWVDKQMWSIRTVEYCLVLKRKEMLTRATTWINLEDIMLSEISQTPKDSWCMIPLYEVPKVIKFVET